MDLSLVRNLLSLSSKDEELKTELRKWEKLFTTSTPVLDYGSVRLDGILADDLSVVNSARVSFGRHKEQMDTADENLLRYLIQNRHGSPLEHNLFRFHVVAPIVVLREWVRHRLANFNEFSGRYAEFDARFYLPEVHNVRTQVGKPGRYTFEQAPLKDSLWFLAKLDEWTERGRDLYKEALGRGIAKEQSRFFLANTVYSEIYFSINARSLMNFISLRNSKDAMYEIRVYAQKLEEHFATYMPVTYRWFLENGRVV